jgi:hypothetical protein
MSSVLMIADLTLEPLRVLVGKYQLQLRLQADDEDIQGSFWGASEAGLVGTTVFVRSDTPIHSLLHEACHLICMTSDRRAGLDRDAGGDDPEEAAVCYLQILLADHIDGVGRERLMQDMDSWGYSFRLGSTRKWFEEDAEDSHNWLIKYGIIAQHDDITFHSRS